MVGDTVIDEVELGVIDVEWLSVELSEILLVSSLVCDLVEKRLSEMLLLMESSMDVVSVVDKSSEMLPVSESSMDDEFDGLRDVVLVSVSVGIKDLVFVRFMELVPD